MLDRCPHVLKLVRSIHVDMWVLKADGVIVWVYREPEGAALHAGLGYGRCGIVTHRGHPAVEEEKELQPIVARGVACLAQRTALCGR